MKAIRTFLVSLVMVLFSATAWADVEYLIYSDGMPADAVITIGNQTFRGLNPEGVTFSVAKELKAADIVVGSKRHPKSVVQYPWHRRIVSGCYFTLVKWFVGLPITDTQTGMKLFKREVLGPALDRMLVKTYAFDLELLIRHRLFSRFRSMDRSCSLSTRALAS